MWQILLLLYKLGTLLWDAWRRRQRRRRIPRLIATVVLGVLFFGALAFIWFWLPNIRI